MKIKNIFLTLIIVTVLVFQSCKKDEEKTNQPPTCQITAPINEQEIIKGETVIISVEANDNDGNITEVSFAIDGTKRGSVSIYPFNYNWTTNNASIGTHILQATSIDNKGTHTSDEISIKVIEGDGTGTFTDPRDGQTYATIDIGNQTWFAKNLNYETSNSSGGGVYGYYYGRLYTWEAALSACPSGWHLPSDDEWKIMEMELGMSLNEANEIDMRGTDEGEKLKSIGGWSDNGYGTNSSGFNAFPGGLLNNWGFSHNVGVSAFFWSSTEFREDVWYRSLTSNNDKVLRSDRQGNYWFSVRCLQD